MMLSDAAGDDGSFSAYNAGDNDDYYPVASMETDNGYQQYTAPPPSQQYTVSSQQPQQMQPQQMQSQQMHQPQQMQPQQQQMQQARLAIIPTQRGTMAPPPLPVPMPSLAAMYPTYSQQSQQPHQSMRSQYAHLPPPPPQEPGYFEIMWSRRRAVVKLIILTLVVLLAISCHATVLHYMKQFIDDVEPTHYQEIALRVAYPLLVLAIMWNLKAFVAV